MDHEVWNILKKDNYFAKQDLALANVLRDYGFTGVLRRSPGKLLAAYDNGPYLFELPSPICLVFVDVGQKLGIDELIDQCRRRCQ